MSQAVLADAQFSVATFLYPFDTFDTEYQGRKVTFPVPLSPFGSALDDNAGQSGYSTHLGNGMRVPMGGRVILWLPYLLASSGGTDVPYIYSIGQRVRNVADYLRDPKGQYHIPVEKGLNAEVIIPAGASTVVYNQTEAAQGVPTVQHLRMEQILAEGPANAGSSPGPDGTTIVWQQGVRGLGGSASDPTFLPYDFHALGDEIFIQVTRSNAVGANWDFFGADTAFAAYYASRNVTIPTVGAMAFTGTAP